MKRKIKPEGTQVRGSAANAGPTSSVWTPAANETLVVEPNASDDDSSGDNSPARSGSGATNNGVQLAYTIKQWCKATNIGATKTYEAISEGKLKSRKCGRHRLILCDEGQEYLHSLPTE
jgi:excisionase family DNA binding protein